MAVQLSFGTAGIRAPMGDADDQLNVRTVRVVAHALARYAGEVVPDARGRGLCLAYDGRAQSERFAREVASVACAHGYRVRMFEKPVPTPLLAFCTRRYNAALGVMITASHNPPSDNGLKVYFAGGAQIVAPHDRNIAQRIASAAPEDERPTGELAAASAAGLLSALGDADIEAYLQAVDSLVPAASELPVPRVAYSALHGVGSALTRRLLARVGVAELHEVASQAAPRPDLGGLTAPNPEHRRALDALWSHAEACAAQIAFCHDPDADRLAVLARTRDGSLRALSGDEVGALLGDFLLSQAPAPTRCVLVSTVVSGELLGEIAREYGARFEQTLTGFKWIAERARAIERESGGRYLFGYEEALGYAFGALGDDKDGIAALHVLLTYARRLHEAGTSLCERLEALARSHGLVATRQNTVSAQGEQGRARVAAILSLLRAQPAAAWLGPGATREDFLERPERADLLVFRTAACARLAVRPSGTEPKLKFYLQQREAVAPDEPLAAAEARAQQALSALEERTRALVDAVATEA